jgi:hypothetical protein
MDLLLIESHTGVGGPTADRLVAEGHSVHRCHDGSATFPCVGVSDPGRCPISGPVDAVVVVRRGVCPSPTSLEDGVPCALRAGIPVVEHGTDVLDPYDDLLDARVGRTESVADACARAIEGALEPVHDRILAAFAPLLEANGWPADAVSVQLSARGTSLRVDLSGPATSGALGGRLAVMASDAVRDLHRRWSPVSISISR